MSATEQQTASARRKLRKFLERTEDGIGAPIIALRDPDNGMLGIKVTWTRQQDGTTPLTGFERPSLDRRIVDSIIVECRVFFMAQEDCYLPGIVKALQLLSPERARALDPLKQHVAQIIRGGALVSPQGQAPMYSGRLEMDNGLGPGKLLGADQITMDYINGIAFHEDDERRARLENVSGMDSILFAVILQLDGLLRVLANVRAQVEHDIEVGHITIQA